MPEFFRQVGVSHDVELEVLDEFAHQLCVTVPDMIHADRIPFFDLVRIVECEIADIMNGADQIIERFFLNFP